MIHLLATTKSNPGIVTSEPASLRTRNSQISDHNNNEANHLSPTTKMVNNLDRLSDWNESLKVTVGRIHDKWLSHHPTSK